MFTNQYLGKKIDGWKIASCINAPGRHKIYTLTKEILWTKRAITVRDNVLTQLSSGKMSMQDAVMRYSKH